MTENEKYRTGNRKYLYKLVIDNLGDINIDEYSKHLSNISIRNLHTPFYMYNIDKSIIISIAEQDDTLYIHNDQCYDKTKLKINLHKVLISEDKNIENEIVNIITFKESELVERFINLLG